MIDETVTIIINEMGSKYKYEKPIYQAKAKVTNTTRKGSLIVTKESTMEIIKK